MAAPDRQLEDWAEGKCLSKGFLDCMAGGRGAGFDLYLRFLNEVSLMDDELSFSGLSRFGSVNPSMVGAYQYKISEPTVEPTHWSIFSEGDVNRIGGICGFRMVVYNYDNSGRQCPKVPSRVPLSYWPQRTQGGDKRLTLWHDARLDWDPEENEEPPPLCVFVATTAASPKRLFCVPSWQAPLLDSACNVWFGNQNGPVSRVGLELARDGGGNYLNLVDKLLDLQPPEDDDDQARVTELKQLWLIDRHRLHQRWANASKCVVLLSFERRWGKPHPKCWKPKNLRFCCMAITSDLNPPDVSNVDFVDHAAPDAKVVCFYGHTYAVLLSEPFRLQAISYHLDTRGLAQKLFNRSDLSSVPRTLPEETVREARLKRAAQKRPRAGDRIEKKCKCRTCRSGKYSENMATSGPERLCTVSLTLKDLLRMLGAMTKDADAMIARMVELSVASMDVESQTTPLNLDGPRPGPRTSYPEFGGPTLEGHLLHIQRPIMVGHTDTLSRERGERWQDVVADDSPKAVYDMFARYWLKVSRLKRESSKLKKELCAELLQLSQLYSQTYFSFAQGWLEMSRIEKDYFKERDLSNLRQRLVAGSLSQEQHDVLARETVWEYEDSDDWMMAENKALGSAFRNCVPGLLQSSLLKLCHRYIIFNFYG